MSNDTITISKRDQFLTDILCTAVEGGIGYWSQCSDYAWSERFSRDERGVTLYVDAHDVNATDILAESDLDEVETFGGTVEVHRFRVTLDHIANGINTVASGEGGVNSGYVKLALLAAIEGQEELVECDIDSDAADIFLQAGVFGKVIYG